jgi:mannose-6-phosphate isomerase-like protein (cupin superfamily)
VIIIKIINVDDVNIADTPHKVDVRKIITYDHATIVRIELKPGEGLKTHITPVDVCFFVLEGEGIVHIGKEKEPVKKNQLIFSPAKVPHTLMNESDANFSFLVIKTPTPTSETKML